MKQLLQRSFVVVLLSLAAFAIYGTRQWPLVGDTVLMHYTAFLFDHGFSPYSQMTNINLPGCLFFDWTVMHLLGIGSSAARFADFLLLAISTAAMIVIARRYHWVAGLFAGVLLTAIHLRDGIDQTCERDLILATLLLLACACLFEARRYEHWAYSAAFGLATGCALLIKPTASLWVVTILLVAMTALRKRGRSRLLVCTGLLLPLLFTSVFLLHERAFDDLIVTFQSIVPYHATVDRLGLTELLTQLLPSAILPLFFAWLLLTIWNRNAWDPWEHRIVLFSILFGMASFLLQGKGFLYHRYPAEAFLFLAFGIDAHLAVRRSPVLRLAGASLLLWATVVAGADLVKASHYDWSNRDLEPALTADLNHLSGAKLSGHVQCIDTFGGCVRTLYDMQLVESTGDLYDCYYFHQPQAPASLNLRNRFLADVEKAPPQVIVVTDQLCFNEPSGYGKLDRWPAFRDWLNAHYTLYSDRKEERPVAWWPHPKPAIGYRVYTLASAQTH